MGRWGPASGMPIRYDQSRCCAELAAKQRLWQRLRDGLRPGDDYELPSVVEDAKQLKDNAESAKRKREVCQTTKPSQPLLAGRVPRCVKVVINHKTGVMHNDPPCNHVRNPSLSHYETATEEQTNLHLYQRCERCFKPGGQQSDLTMPHWYDLPEDESEGGESDTESLSGSSSSSE